MKTNRSIGLILTTALALCAAGCFETAPPVNYHPADGAAVVVPTSAKYTILCCTFNGPTHMVEAEKARNDLLATTKSMDKWYVTQSADKSLLYYGFYTSMDPRAVDKREAAEGARAINDLAAIRSITDSRGVRPFSTSILESVYNADPEEIPQWSLLKTKGFWSLEVAVYKGTPDRKQLALEAVKQARNAGYEAYYFHGPASSSVCIGSWPRNSVIERTGEKHDADPDRPIYITTGELPGGIVADKGAEVVKPDVEIEDPTLIEALRTHHEHSLNGYTTMKTMVNPRTKQTEEVAEQPLLIHIPDRIDTAEIGMTDPAFSRNDEHSFNVPAPQQTGDPIDDPATKGLPGLDKR